MLKQIIMDDGKTVSVEEFADFLVEVGNETAVKTEVVRLGKETFLEMITNIEREKITEHSLMALLAEYTSFYLLKELMGLTK